MCLAYVCGSTAFDARRAVFRKWVNGQNITFEEYGCGLGKNLVQVFAT
jgi:hypothetical protein